MSRCRARRSRARSGSATAGWPGGSRCGRAGARVRRRSLARLLPVPIPEESLVELPGVEAWQLRVEVDRARALVRREVLTAVRQELRGEVVAGVVPRHR